VVEDEEAVRTLVHRTLVDSGYQVVEATNGKQGMECVLAANPPVALVVCDVVLPEMSGDALGRRLASVRPELPVLYMSGYPGSEMVKRGVISREVPFIEKPFNAEHLARVVRRLLDRVD
jgi:DNA-binding NtrC family response regulator